MSYVEMLQGSCLNVCKVSGEPTQIVRKIKVGHKDYVWLPWQQQIGRFYQDLSEDQQFYLMHTKLSREYGNEVAYSKDVLRHHLFRKCCFQGN